MFSLLKVLVDTEKKNDFKKKKKRASYTVVDLWYVVASKNFQMPSAPEMECKRRCDIPLVELRMQSLANLLH